MNAAQIEQYAKDCEGKTDLQLIEELGGWKPDTAGRLIVQRELDRRSDKKKDRPVTFRSWITVAIGLLSVALALATFLYTR